MVIMVSYNPRFNFVYKLQVFQDFWGEKNVHRVLVLNLVEISKDFLIFIFLLLKLTLETRFESEPVAYILNKQFVRGLCATRAREHFKLYPLIFYPVYFVHAL